MFKELTQQWSTHLLARHTHKLIPTWTPQYFQRETTSRAAETYYIRCCFTHNDTRSSRHRFSQGVTSNICTRCNLATEDVNHLLLECPTLTPSRNKLMNTIKQSLPNIEFTLNNILTNPNLQHYIINYINENIRNE